MRITDRIIGGTLKFHDFYSSIDEYDIKEPRNITDIYPMTDDEIYKHIGETRYTDKITTIQNNLLRVFDTLKETM